MKNLKIKKRRLALTLVAIGTAAFGACAGSQASPDGQAEGVDSVQEMQDFLSEARGAAAAYGQKHLGHYLGLTEEALVKSGLDVPQGIDLTMTTGHKGYCIRADASGLDASDPWSVATVNSGIPGISKSDSCKT